MNCTQLWLRMIRFALSYSIAIAAMAAFNHLSFGQEDVHENSEVARLRKLGAKVGIDENRPGRPVVSLDLNSAAISDSDMEEIGKFALLRELHLDGCSRITDTGIRHLRDLKYLDNLGMYDTAITDAGLKELKGLSQSATT